MLEINNLVNAKWEINSILSTTKEEIYFTSIKE